MIQIEKITFDNLPQAVLELMKKVDRLTDLLTTDCKQSDNDWMDLQILIDYLPGRPVKSTIYSIVSRRLIPHKKNGKRLIFLKSEIDSWLMNKNRNTATAISENAHIFLKK